MRICARLDLKGEKVIKGLQMEGLREVGSISSLSQSYFQQGADEIILLDATSSWFSVDTKPEVIAKLVENIFIPITVGGGIKELRTADNYFSAGADKVALNTVFFKNRKIAKEISQKYGAQATVLQLNVKEIDGKFFCYIENGRTNTELEVDQVLKSLSHEEIGEILLTSIDKDGTMDGSDLKLIKHMLDLTDLPIIYSGGISSHHDCVDLYNLGLRALAIGAALHYKKIEIGKLKQYLFDLELPCRLESNV